MTEFSYCEKRLGVKYPWGSRLGKRTGLSQKLDKSHAGLHRASSRSCFGPHPLFSLTNSVRRQGGGYCDYNLCSVRSESEVFSHFVLSGLYQTQHLVQFDKRA